MSLRTPMVPILLGLALLLTQCGPDKRKLDVVIAGSGKVVSAPTGINCSNNCAADFDLNAQVILTPTASTGFSFTGWGGDCAATNQTCTLKMTSAKIALATFKQDSVDNPPTLSVSSPADGATVTSPNLTVSGTASDDKGISQLQYSLNGGAPQNIAGTSSFSFNVVLNQGSNSIKVIAKDTAGQQTPVTLNVTYNVPPSVKHKLTVSVSGNGSLSSSPAGIGCPGTCSFDFDAGTTVTLNATPGSGQKLEAWSGACTGSGACSVTMDGARSVNATFVALTVPDTTKPTVKIDAPTNGFTVNTPNITVNGTASDNVGVVELQYSLNGAARQTIAVSSGFSFSVSLKDGANTVEVFAKDAAGLEGNASVSVTYVKPDFSLATDYSADRYFIAQKADALIYVKIIRSNGFAVQGKDFDSASISGAVMGSGPDRVQATFKKELSEADKLAFVLVGGSVAPTGTHDITISATSGSLSKSIPAKLEVTECSLGCN